MRSIKRKYCLLLLSCGGLMRVGLECMPEPDLTDPLSSLVMALGWI
ncbi:MAG: hypothetical protein ABIG44_01090 [Planctomycetota bacterium]